MAAFDVEAFVSDPSLIAFDRCKKSDLRVIAEHYGLPVSSSLVKAELKAVLLDELVNRGVFSLPVYGAAVSLGEDPQWRAVLILRWWKWPSSLLLLL